MGTIKDKHGTDLIYSDEIKKRWKGYMEEVYKKGLNEPDYYDGAVSHPEPDTGVRSHVNFKKHCC